MYLQRVEEITPNIRYCAYNLEEGTTDISDLMQLKWSAATAAGGTHDPVLTAKIDVSATVYKTVKDLGYETICWKGNKHWEELVDSKQLTGKIMKEEM